MVYGMKAKGSRLSVARDTFYFPTFFMVKIKLFLNATQILAVPRPTTTFI